jgi:hypothetical protein
MKTPAGASWARYDESNRAAAAIILRDVDGHGGESAIAVQWATAYLARTPVSSRRKAPEADQGQLFVREPAGSGEMVFGC